MENIYLDTCDKNQLILKKYFSKTINFDELYNLYIKKLSFDAASSLEIDLLENELNNILNNPNKDTTIIENAKFFYNQLVNKILNSNNYNNNLILSSNIFHKFKNLYDKETYEKIGKLILSHKENIKLLSEKYLNGEILSEQEYKILFSDNFEDYLTDFQEKIFRKLITSDKNTNFNFYEIKFICDYINFVQSSELNYDRCKIYFGEYIPYFNAKTGEITKSNWKSISNGGCSTNYGIMLNTMHIFYSKIININSIASIIASISHESLHMKQKNDFLKGKITLEFMAEVAQRFLYNGYQSYDLYKVNYDFHETEFQANYQSYITLIELQEKYNINFDISRYKKLLNELIINHSYSMIIPTPDNPNSKVHMLEEYTVKKMEEVFRNNPHLLNIKLFNVYNWFYNKDGSLKTLDEITKKLFSISAPKERKEEITQMFIPFLSYALNNENNISVTPDIIRIIKLLKQYEEQQIETMSKGKETFQYNINHHLKFIDKRFENADEFLIAMRNKKLQKYDLLLSKISTNEVSQNQNNQQQINKEDLIKQFKEKIGLFNWQIEKRKINMENEKRRKNGKKNYPSSDLIFNITNLNSSDDIIELSNYIMNWEDIEEIYKELHNYNMMSEIEKNIFDELLHEKFQFITSELKRINEELKERIENEKADKVEQYNEEYRHRRL